MIMAYKQSSLQKLQNAIPAIVSITHYQPTVLQLKVLCVYLQALDSGEVKKPTEILRGFKKKVQNWYYWQKKMGFIDWWNAACQEYHKNVGLSSVHSHMLRRATQESAQDAKMYMERFDPKYKPAVAVEHYAGVMPPEGPGSGADAVEQSRKFIESVDKDVVNEQQTEALPSVSQGFDEEQQGSTEGVADIKKEQIQAEKAPTEAPHPPVDGEEDEVIYPSPHFSQDGEPDSSHPQLRD